MPDHIDWRAAYGRRKTQDFGFPGARIKPHRANWNQRPLQVHSGQNKGSNSHSPPSRTIEAGVSGRARSYPQLLARNMQQGLHEIKKQRTWKQASKVPPTSNPIRSSTTLHQEHYAQQQFSHMSSDKCGDRLANTLGYMIDDLLQEHSNSLQDVIQNIKDGQRNLPQLRRSPDKIEMHTGPAYTTYQSPRTYEELHFSKRSGDRIDTKLQDQFFLWLREHR